MYLADSLTSLEHDDLSDLEKPASIRFVSKGKRGNTDLTTALVAIRVESLFDRLPKYFRTKENDETTEGEDSERPKPRTTDWLITPFTTEWHYKVTAPLGFKLRALPSDKDEKVDTLSFTQKYSTNSEGSIVEAFLRVENTNTRMTVQQAKDLREAVLKARAVDRRAGSSAEGSEDRSRPQPTDDGNGIRLRSPGEMGRHAAADSRIAKGRTHLGACFRTCYDSVCGTEAV